MNELRGRSYLTTRVCQFICSQLTPCKFNPSINRLAFATKLFDLVVFGRCFPVESAAVFLWNRDGRPFSAKPERAFNWLTDETVNLRSFDHSGSPLEREIFWDSHNIRPRISPVGVPLWANMTNKHDGARGPKNNSQTPHTGDVTLWLKSIERGDNEAAERLWKYCMPRLLKYSRRRLPQHLKRVLDEEDVALSAFKSFCLAAADGGFPHLEGRDELWKLLLVIAGRKAQAHVRRETREKRGGGKVRGESIFLLEGSPQDKSEATGIGQVAEDQPTPDQLAQFTEDARRLIDMLKDDTIKAIALLRMEGYSVEEIAERLECGKRTVERRLHLIRRTWAESSKSIENESQK